MIKVFHHLYSNPQFPSLLFLHCYSEECILISESEAMGEISAVESSAFGENLINSN